MRHRLLTHLALLSLALLTGWAATRQPSNPGRWMAGDFHQHSTFTDGRFPLDEVLVKGFEYGLGWAANSEHGGSGYRDGQGRNWDDRSAYPQDPTRGDEKFAERTLEQNGERTTVRNKAMWRWQSLTEYAFRIIQRVRRENPKNLAATGLEWNVPGHEHCSVGIVAEDAMPIGEFEYRFDRGDKDTSGGPGGVWAGKDLELSGHPKAVAAVEWMQTNYPETGWIAFAHPERASSYTIADFRDFNNAGPTVAFGFEGLPGHQRSAQRGGYRERAVGGGTFGGAGWYIAEVGGLWDALLGEGRNWWTFVSSDFHSLSSDFWPGQYAKTWTWVADKDGDGAFTLADVPGGLRSGNTFCVHGDLIDRLDFRAEGPRREAATMGQTLRVAKGGAVEIKIRFRSPKRNDNGDKPKVRAVQLISGRVTGRVEPFLADGVTPNPEYANPRNETTKIAALYRESDLKRSDDGWYEAPVYRIGKVEHDMYFRLRGSSFLPDVRWETDAQGNPLPDSLVRTERDISTTEAAWRDLWFYSNPVFVKTR